MKEPNLWEAAAFPALHLRTCWLVSLSGFPACRDALGRSLNEVWDCRNLSISCDEQEIAGLCCLALSYAAQPHNTTGASTHICQANPNRSAL